jgi:hypothetical protein
MPQKPAPTDAEVTAASAGAAKMLEAAAARDAGEGADAAKRLAAAFAGLAHGSPLQRQAAHDAVIMPLAITLDNVAQSLAAAPVTLDSLPPELVRQWRSPDGQWRVEAIPRGDANDNDVLKRFTAAVRPIAPDAVGAPIALQESGDTIVGAFAEAGTLALVSIAILLFVVLRRPTDVLLTLVPLLLAGAVTLEISVLIGLKLNFANIIALPLLLGLGVAFKIYFVMAWRAGVTALLQSSLTRAVIFSALTSATAFGSLWLSNHPGTSSMGKLLALSLICTLAAAVLFQPALMGPPRAKEGEEIA